MKKRAPAYIAPHDVYTGGVLYAPGDVFLSDAPKGRLWAPASEAQAEAAAARAAPTDKNDPADDDDDDDDEARRG